MPPFLPLLALSSEDQPMLVYMVILGLIALGPALHSWIKVYQFARGQTPDMAKFVTHDQLAVLKADRDKQMAESLLAIRGDMNDLKREIRDDLQSFEEKADELKNDLMSLHRALGRVEGHDEAEARAPRRAR